MDEKNGTSTNYHCDLRHFQVAHRLPVLALVWSPNSNHLTKCAWYSHGRHRDLVNTVPRLALPDASSCFIMFHARFCLHLPFYWLDVVGIKSALAVATKDWSAQCGMAQNLLGLGDDVFEPWWLQHVRFRLVLSLLVYFPRFVMKHVVIPPDQFLKSLRFFRFKLCELHGSEKPITLQHSLASASSQYRSSETVCCSCFQSKQSDLDSTQRTVAGTWSDACPACPCKTIMLRTLEQNHPTEGNMIQ